MRNRVPTRLARLAVLAMTILLGLAAAETGRADTRGGGAGPAAGLRLTVTAKEPAPSRTVLLICEPAPGGRHPLAATACAALDASGGNFDALSGQSGVCAADYAPVTTTAEGTFRGRDIQWRKKFANPCILRAATGPVFAF